MRTLPGYIINDEIKKGGCTTYDVELKQFFCRIGSKRPIVKELLELIPPHCTYIEPFVGGGSVYWAKQPAKISVINDLDKNLIEGYKLLKSFSKNESPDKFPIKNTTQSIQKLVDKRNPDKYEELLGYLYQSCNTFGNIGMAGKIYKENNQGNKISKISDYISKIKDTVILSVDHKEVVNKYDSQKSFFFLDPPYENSNKLYYEDSIDYEEMAFILSNIDGNFLLTIIDSPSKKKIFKNFKIHKIRVPPGSGHTKAKIGGKFRYELIITNY